jgi:hypothetical protein
MYTKGQAQKRRMEFFRDQFGRAWKANIEIDTGDPCECLSPEGWTAPQAPSWMRGHLVPPEDCREMVPIQERNLRGFQVRINHNKWLASWDAAYDSWLAKFRSFAVGMAGGGDVQTLMDNPTPALREIAGPKPFPPREFIEACAAGNPWALGQVDAVPAKAQSMVDALRPLVVSRRPTADQAVDPFADEDEQGVASSVEAFAPLVPDPFAAESETASVRPRRK